MRLPVYKSANAFFCFAIMQKLLRCDMRIANGLISREIMRLIAVLIVGGYSQYFKTD